MVLLSMISYSIFVRINLNAYSHSLFRFSFKVRHYIIFFEFVNHFFIFLAVPRPFVHLRVEIVVLLSMSSDWIFVRINLNAYSCGLRCSFVSKFSAILFVRVCELLSH